MNYEINSNVIRFVLGGNSLFTIMNGDKQYSYRVYRKETNDGSKIFCVCYRKANKNIYIGYIRIDGNKLRFKSSYKNQIGFNDEIIQTFAKTIQNRNNLDALGIHVYHNGRCAYCGRELTDLESIERGFGPYCWKKIKIHCG